MAALTTKSSSSFGVGRTTTTSQHTPFAAEDQPQQQTTTTEVVNRDPSFGSFLLNDDFGQRATTDDDDYDDLKALDPLKLEGVEKQREARTRTENAGKKGESRSRLEPLLRNPNGATQLFTDMHGVSIGIEDVPEVEEGGAMTGMRHGLTEDSPRLGVTDWGTGTDGGRSGKLQDGVPYGSFSGV